jgi:hypothetical protein
MEVFSVVTFEVSSETIVIDGSISLFLECCAGAPKKNVVK